VPTVTRAAVVDASAVCALLFGEPDGEQVADDLGGSALMAPALLFFEVANVCLTKMRRHRSQRDALLLAFDRLSHLGISIVEVDVADALVLAERTGLTAYDASYLWLAMVKQAELITLDRDLAAARKALLRG
jgi:predicted nucleic acid-binding protein